MKLFTKTQIVGLGFCLALSIQAQGTSQWTVAFEGGLDPDAGVLTKYYFERGMEFRPINPDGQFGRSGGQDFVYAYPRNGTAYVFAGFGDSLSVKQANNLHFGLVSVDIAEWSTLYATPKAIQFIGYWANGTAVTTTFVTDGIIDGAGPLNDFQTFHFDWRFGDITHLEVPGYSWNLDNMVFSTPIPEPGFAALGMTAAAVLSLLRRRDP